MHGFGHAHSLDPIYSGPYCLRLTRRAQLPRSMRRRRRRQPRQPTHRRAIQVYSHPRAVRANYIERPSLPRADPASLIRITWLLDNSTSYCSVCMIEPEPETPETRLQSATPRGGTDSIHLRRRQRRSHQHESTTPGAKRRRGDPAKAAKITPLPITGGRTLARDSPGRHLQNAALHVYSSIDPTTRSTSNGGLARTGP